ncbi:hypothetical protein A4A49_53927, partial [Nicotiana attenuata]
HDLMGKLGTLISLMDITPRPDLVEAMLTFWDPQGMVFKFGDLEMTPTLAEIAGLTRLPYLDKDLIYTRTHSSTKFLKIRGMDLENHMGCLDQSWVPLDFLFERFARPTGYETFVDEFSISYDSWKKRRPMVFAIALLGLLAWIDYLGSLTKEKILWSYLWIDLDVILGGCRVQDFLVVIGLWCTRPYTPARVMRQLGRRQKVPYIPDSRDFIGEFDTMPHREADIQTYWRHAMKMGRDTLAVDPHSLGYTHEYFIWLQSTQQGVSRPLPRCVRGVFTTRNQAFIGAKSRYKRPECRCYRFLVATIGLLQVLA